MVRVAPSAPPLHTRTSASPIRAVTLLFPTTVVVDQCFPNRLICDAEFIDTAPIVHLEACSQVFSDVVLRQSK